MKTMTYVVRVDVEQLADNSYLANASMSGPSGKWVPKPTEVKAEQFHTVDAACAKALETMAEQLDLGEKHAFLAGKVVRGSKRMVEPSKMIEVGFWYPGLDKQGFHYPRVEAAVDPSWDPAERALVLAYLKSGKTHEQYRGCSPCRVCGISNGSQEFTDNVYVWPEGYAHYVELHDVKPPQEFLEHILRIRRFAGYFTAIVNSSGGGSFTPSSRGGT